MPNHNQTTIGHIIIERIEEKDGSFGWTWDAYDNGDSVASGAAPSLSVCVDSMREYLRSAGVAP